MSRAKGSLSTALCLGGLLCLQIGETQSPPNGDALVKKMIATYRAASTIRNESQATIIDPTTGRYEQRAIMVYKKPNKLYFSSVDPQQGTISIYADGRLLAIYGGKQNIFTRRNAPLGFVQTVALAEKATLDALRVSITQLLSPVSFLISNGTIREANSFKVVGTETVIGYKTYKLQAQANPFWLKAMMPPKSKVQFVKKEITLWIDARRSFLVKASAQLVWKTTLPGDGITPARTIPGGLFFEETHRTTVLNASVKDEEFLFVPPKNAKELFQERRN